MARVLLSSGSLMRIALLYLLAGLTLCAQQLDAPPATSLPSNEAGSTNSLTGAAKEERVAAIELEMTNAIQRVIQIVNRPVQAYARPHNTTIANFNEDWFHPGAVKPNFDKVDIRKFQELIYAQHKYVTSSLNPGVVFLGQDLEFNSMTKYFYTNRSLPKRRLTEAEMLEINQLYRVIGRCEHELAQLQAPPAGAEVQPTAAEESAEKPVLGQSFERLRSIPQATRVLYGGIAIGSLILIVALLRLVRKTR